MPETIKNKYDVIIVGAGPSGLAAATELAKNNQQVLIIEKNKLIGPKVCAGGLTTKDFALGIPEQLASRKFKTVTLNTPLQSSIVKSRRNFIITVDRKDLGQWMKTNAKKYGVNFLTDQVTKLNKNKNQLSLKSGRKIAFNYLIGADGSNSIIRQQLNLPKNKVLTLYQYLVKKPYSKMEFFIDLKKFGPSYIWIFPHKNFTSIGAFSNNKIFSVQKNKQNFETWLNQHRIDLTQAKYESWTINYDYQCFNFNNIFLVGDAGGFTSGLTGEGIYFAMVSGIEAAKKIINPNYNLVRLKEILKIKRDQEKFLDSLNPNSIWSEIKIELINLISKTTLFDEKIIDKLT